MSLLYQESYLAKVSWVLKAATKVSSTLYKSLHTFMQDSMEL